MPWKESEKSNLWKYKDSAWQTEEQILNHKTYIVGILPRCQIKLNELDSVWGIANIDIYRYFK